MVVCRLALDKEELIAKLAVNAAAGELSQTNLRPRQVGQNGKRLILLA
jgi:hypothetical protein